MNHTMREHSCLFSRRRCDFSLEWPEAIFQVAPSISIRYFLQVPQIAHYPSRTFPTSSAGSLYLAGCDPFFFCPYVLWYPPPQPHVRPNFDTFLTLSVLPQQRVRLALCDRAPKNGSPFHEPRIFFPLVLRIFFFWLTTGFPL